MKKIILSIIISIAMLQCTWAGQPQVNAQSAVLMDMASGQVLWEKNSNEPMAMASTTKIMTAVIALEQGNMADIVEVSKKASQTAPVKMYLQAGEKISLENLMYAMMLQSSNDAAVAISEHIGGSVQGFAQLMNDKAKEIGCNDTLFVTPNGLDSGNHHSTAYDMALIARYALQNDEFIKIINTPQISFSSDKKSYNVVNKNRLLTEYEGAFGVKTGFTGKAGHCFVGAAKREDKAYISVVLASGWGSMGKSKKWSDTKAILNYGFEAFEKKVLYEKGFSCGEVRVDFSDKERVAIIIDQKAEAILNKDNSDKTDIVFSLPQSIEAPVKKGDKIGVACVLVNGQTVASVNIVADETAERLRFWDYFKKVMDIWCRIM